MLMLRGINIQTKSFGANSGFMERGFKMTEVALT